MAPTVVTTPELVSSGSTGVGTTTTLTSSSFTPSNGEVIVIKLATWDTGGTMAAPTGGSQTYTQQVIDNPGANFPWVAIYTTVISGSPGAMTISSATAGTASIHSMVIERWSGATLAATPATFSSSGAGTAASGSLTTTAANSVISLVDVDWNGADPTGHAFTNSANVTDEGNVYSGSNTTQYYWYQTVASAGSTSIGMTTPATQRWAMAAIEIKDSGSGSDGFAHQQSASGLYPTANTTTGSTWTNTTNANGSTTGTVATFTSATSGAQGALLASGYGVQTAIGSQPMTIDSVTCAVNAYVATVARWSSITVQLYDGASTPIGSTQSYTLSTSTSNTQTLTFTGANCPTWAQCSDLRVNLVATKSGTTSSTFNVDVVGPLTVTYTTFGWFHPAYPQVLSQSPAVTQALRLAPKGAAQLERAPQPASTVPAEQGPATIGLAATGTETKVAVVTGSTGMGLATAGNQVGSVLRPQVTVTTAQPARPRLVGGTTVPVRIPVPQVAYQGGTTSLGLAGTGTETPSVLPTSRTVVATAQPARQRLVGGATLLRAPQPPPAGATAELGTAAVGLAASGAAVKVVAVAGATGLGLAATAADKKIAPQAGPAALGATATGVEKKTAVEVGTTTAGLAAAGTAARKTAQLGTATAGLVGTYSGFVIRPVTGTTALGMAGTGLQTKKAASAGAAALGVAARSVQAKTVAPPGVSALGTTSRASVAKKVTATGTGSIAASGTGSALKAVASRGSAALGLSGDGNTVYILDFLPHAGPLTDLAIRNQIGTAVSLAVLKHAGTITDLTGRNTAGTITDLTVEPTAGTVVDLATRRHAGTPT